MTTLRNIRAKEPVKTGKGSSGFFKKLTDGPTLTSKKLT